MSASNNNLNWKYAGMVMQFFSAIGLAVFLGYKTDNWLGTSRQHIFAVAFPLLTIIGLIVKVFMDTRSKK